MPNAPPHPCGKPGCPNLAPHGKARCEAHDQDSRESAAARGYGADWRRYRKSFLAAHPLCELCLTESMLDLVTGDVARDPAGNPVCGPVPATVVDHVRDHKGDQRLFWDPKNHRALCAPHHNRRTDAGDFGRPQPLEPA